MKKAGLIVICALVFLCTAASGAEEPTGNGNASPGKDMVTMLDLGAHNMLFLHQILLYPLNHIIHMTAGMQFSKLSIC